MIEKLPNVNVELENYRIFSDVGFIVTDLDGTLTIGSNPVRNQIKEKVLFLRKKHIYTTIATGRPYRGAVKLVEEIGIEKGMPIALYNGGLLVEYGTQNIINSCNIPFENVKDIIHLVETCGAGIYIYTFDIPVIFCGEREISNHVQEEIYYSGKTSVEKDINGFTVKQMNMDEIEEKNIFSILIVRAELTNNIQQNLIHYLDMNSMITYTDSGSGFIEIKGVEYNKSVIINELKNRIKNGKLKPQKILAIGDNDNDIELFEAADISVAVANSSKAAIDKADYVCEHENADGFLDMLMVIEFAKHFFR
jgi:hypothetical protein